MSIVTAEINLQVTQNVVHGQARCLQCNHRWSAFAKSGELWLKCPHCKSEKAYLVQHVEPIGLPIWVCKTTGCGSRLFFIMQGKMLCPGCGETKDWP